MIWCVCSGGYGDVRMLVFVVFSLRRDVGDGAQVRGEPYAFRVRLFPGRMLCLAVGGGQPTGGLMARAIAPKI